MVSIEIKDLRKSYGSFEVLKGVNLSIKAGEITAILGPNASGKTTLLKSILGLVIPDSGDVMINGKSVREDNSYKKLIGYMPQEPSFPENLSLSDLISLLTDIRDQHPDEEIERLTELFRIKEFMKKPIGSLSGGTKQKVSALIALAFDPDVLILDEPTVGLDPVSSSKLKDEIRRKKDSMKTVLLTSHIMNEVEELADRVVLLIEGTVRVDSSISELKKRTGASSLEKALAKLLEENFV